MCVRREEWENVSHCLQITSDSCDLSEVFDDFYLYNFVRLGLNQGHGKINWTLPQLCDPVKGRMYHDFIRLLTIRFSLQ